MSEINDTEEIPEGNFPINLKLIEYYQRTEPRLLPKYENGAYHKGSFLGVINIYVIPLKCEDKSVITEILQCYVLHWYFTYLLHPGMELLEVTILQDL